MKLLSGLRNILPSFIQDGVDIIERSLGVQKDQEALQANTWEEKVEQLSAQLEQVKPALEKQEYENRTLRRANRKLTDILNKRDQDYRTLASQYELLFGSLAASNEESKCLENKLRYCMAKLDDLQTKYDKKDQILEIRTRELQGAQEYFHAIRPHSGADVIRLVSSLNGQIMQAAAELTEGLGIDQMASPRDGSQLDDMARKKLASFMSEEMMKMFDTLDSDGLESAIQNGLQAAIVHCCKLFINSWSMDETVDRLLRDIYQKQSQSPVARRWRAITKENSKYTSPDMLPNIMYSNMTEFIAPVLAIAGWVAKNEVHKSKVERVVQERLSAIVKQAVQLDRIVGLEMISEEFEVFNVPMGDPFRVNLMDDVYEERASKAPNTGARVLCTCELGLRCYGAEGRWEVLLKPKVLLDTSF